MSPSLALVLLLVSAGPQEAPPWKAEVDARLSEGAVDQALETLERHLAAEPRDAEAERALARALERLVDEGGSPLALSDARDAWDRALALEPFDLETLRGAVAVRLRLQEYEPAEALAARAIGSAWLVRGDLPGEFLALACRARIGAYHARSQGSAEERMRDLASTWAALKHARERLPESVELATLAANLLETEGLADLAAGLLTEVLERSPETTELHQRLVDLFLRAGVEERLPALYERWSERGTNATLAWYGGYVWRLSGDLAQRERRFREALEAYARSGEWLRVAATLEPAFRETAETLRFQGEVSSVWCELDSGELDRASARALSLLRSASARREEPDGLGRSLMHALSSLGQHRVERNDFEHAAAEARAVVAVVSDDATLWNNLGFLLREYGTQLESGTLPEVAQRETRSREVYRESWRAYLTATELRAEDARVINDAALIQVYHLRDELSRAESMLQQAIRIGEAQLTALGEDPPEPVRFPLAQAVGDAYLNLGYLYYHVYRQPGRAREFFARSIATDSGDRSNLEPYLSAVDGEGTLPEEDRGRFVQPPFSEDPERASIDWEGSLAEARERARSEGRPLLIYNRGDALGLAIPYLDALVTSPAFAARSRGAVLVVCDRVRRTFVDRRHDGRRVACPQWTPLTCSEHQQAALDFGAWHRELTGAEPGESEEGLFLLLPGSERPERIADLEQLPVLTVENGEGLSPAPFEAVEASLGGGDGGGEARLLVATRSQAARESVERILREGFASSPARGHLLRALAEDDHPASRAALAACVRQTADAELELAALEVWPAGLDLEPLMHALCWSPEETMREAARAVIERERPQDESLRARDVVRD